MAQENERARTIERVMESLPPGELDMKPVTEDFEYEQHFGSTEGLYVGEAGLRRWIETFYEVWDQASVKVETVRDAGDRIVSTGRTTVRGSLTEIEVELRWTGIWRFAPDGRACRLDAFNEDDAAEAALRAE
jgi:ketosteroid isomerase-like protein